jgi:hypothetical protein
MKLLRSLKNFAENPNAMCHASWPANIGIFMLASIVLVLFGWASVGLYYEGAGIPELLFSVAMTLGGLLLFVGEIIEMYLKAFVLPTTKLQHG